MVLSEASSLSNVEKERLQSQVDELTELKDKLKEGKISLCYVLCYFLCCRFQIKFKLIVFIKDK